MSLITEIQRDMKQAEADIPATCTWGSATFPCSVSSRRTSRDFDIGGAEVDMDYRLTVRLNAVADDGATVFSDCTVPTPGRRITVGSEAMDIASVDKVNNAYYIIGLKPTATR